MPTIDEKNAAFVVAKAKIRGWVRTLLPHNVPFIGDVQQMAINKLDSQQGTDMLLDEVTGILEAAEKARAGAK